MSIRTPTSFVSGHLGPLFLPLLTVAFSLAALASSSVEDGRKDAAKSLATEIQQAHFQKVYVADFLDQSGIRNEQGCYFASVFSTNLTKIAQDFVVVNRLDAQKKLDELHISAQNFQQPEGLTKAATALGADAVLTGSASISSADASLSLSLRDAASSKEVHAMDYHEKLQSSFEANFPAGRSEDDRVYYFEGMDGISPPKCKHCPNPSYTDAARRKKFQGSVMLSVVVDEEGTLQDVRVLQDPGYGLAQQSIASLKKWRMEPSRDPQGRPVKVRVGIETIFRLY